MSEAHDVSSVLESLAQCRDKIEGVDAQIVALLAQRLGLGRELGRLKRDARLPVRDPEREAAVARRVAELATAAELPIDAVREMFRQIMDMSRRAQETG